MQKNVPYDRLILLLISVFIKGLRTIQKRLRMTNKRRLFTEVVGDLLSTSRSLHQVNTVAILLIIV